MHSGNASTSEGIQGVNPLIFTGKHLEHRLHRAEDERQRRCRHIWLPVIGLLASLLFRPEWRLWGFAEAHGLGILVQVSGRSYDARHTFRCLLAHCCDVLRLRRVTCLDRHRHGLRESLDYFVDLISGKELEGGHRVADYWHQR